MAYTTINKSTDYFNTKLYSGNGSNGNAQTGVGFQPDWTWIKHRNGTASHVLTDAVRGANKHLVANTNGAEVTSTAYIASFDSDGFTLNNDADINGSSRTYASWNWKANGTGSANTDGSINTTATSVNTTAGFSISKYTGTGSAGTVGHGLGVIPKIVLIKQLNGDGAWNMYHASIGNNKAVELNTTSAEFTSDIFNDTTPTSSVFSVKTSGHVNGSGNTYVAYCFAEKTGYSKFGKYNGNSSTDGSFIYCGFKPAFVIVKRSDATDNWNLVDTARNPYNEAENTIRPNINDAEYTGTGYGIDILSNGFKTRTADGNFNNSSGTYIYLAFGQSLVGSNNIPCTAR